MFLLSLSISSGFDSTLAKLPRLLLSEYLEALDSPLDNDDVPLAFLCPPPPVVVVDPDPDPTADEFICV